MRRFWSWLEAGEDTGGQAVLVIDQVIDSDTGWYDDAVTPRAFREELSAHPGAVMVEINSPGGDVFAGFEIYNMLRGHGAPVTVRVIGQAASAASLIAMAADKGRLIMSHASVMLVHNPGTVASGNAQVIREQADVLDLIRDVMADIYMQRFSGTREELLAMLDAETVLTPARALALGLCDEVEGAAQYAGAQAAMIGRYVAMSKETMAAIRARLTQPPAPPAPMTAQAAAELLKEADEMIAARLDGGI